MGVTRCRILGLFVLVTWLVVSCVSQAQQTGVLTDNDRPVALGDLPDAPSATLDKKISNSIFGVTPRMATGSPAKKFHRIVQPGEVVVPLTGGEKLELAVVSRFTVSDVASTAFSAGWSQVRNSAPHFGTDSGAFGERLGALALKQTTQSILSYGIYADLFHDDPRYYVMGRQKNVGVRALYSASRLVIAQKDDGRAAINWPKFAGIASSTALTDAYYPARDHGFTNGATAFGVSLFTSILNNEIHEFIGDGLRMVRRNPN